MTVLSVSILESTEQIVAGIPRTVTLSSNIPATIFYTLNGTVPDTTSNVYIEPIALPTDQNTVYLSFFATNGLSSSAVVTKSYAPNLTGTRQRTSAVSGVSSTISNLGLFGSQTAEQTNLTFEQNKSSGLIVNSVALPDVPTGLVDADGYSVGADQPLASYGLIYSTDTNTGRSGPNIGTLPKVKITMEEGNPESDSLSKKLFNPKAFVIYQDLETEDPELPPMINRASFSLESPEKTRDGHLFYGSQLDGPSATGNFIRSVVNQRDNTITYYYYDNSVNRWIISKQPHELKDPNVNNMSGMVFPREQGARYVQAWRLFARRTLY